MSIFDKWNWIKRNWLYVIEEATKLNLVFVGGTALNLTLFNEYRASEDIDLYDPYQKTIGTTHEAESIRNLAKNLAKKGFEIKSRNPRAIFVGPNIKIEVFNDGTPFTTIEKKNIQETGVLVFDTQTYAMMKSTALLCRSEYDARDLVDLYIIKKETGISLLFPQQDCNVITNSFHDRLLEISKTKKEDLLIFQTREQVDHLPYGEFEKFKEQTYDWLSRFR